MRVVIQRVKQANVKVNNVITGKIDDGYVLLVCFQTDDTELEINKMINKILNLRLFETNNRFERNIIEARGSILSIPQFTLIGDVRKGNRPSFSKAMNPLEAKGKFEEFNHQLEKSGINVQTGVFKEHMEVSLVNDGPVTIIIDSRDDNHGTQN